MENQSGTKQVPQCAGSEFDLEKAFGADLSFKIHDHSKSLSDRSKSFVIQEGSKSLNDSSKACGMQERSKSLKSTRSHGETSEMNVDKLPSSSFFKVDSLSLGGASPSQKCLSRVLHSNTFGSLLAAVVLFDLVCICVDVDARTEEEAHGVDAPRWVAIARHILYVIFSLELSCRIYVERQRAFHHTWTVLDATVVLTGAIEYVIMSLLSESDLKGVSMMRVLRLCRLLRLLRGLKLFRIFKELRKLLQMMGSCFKTLFWSTLLLMLVMTVWACVAVEIIQPYMREMDWTSCDRCAYAFSSVFMANLTLFQTIIAGDSWGLIAVPVIEAHPWTAIFFAGSIMTLIFGVLNLIVAVIVDSFAEMRARDVGSLAKDMEYEELEEKAQLRKLFQKIDWDQDGMVSYGELQSAAERLAEFRAHLRILDVDKKDLQTLFSMVDVDASGAIDPKEFIEAMYRLKNAESKTANKFIHHIVTNVQNKTSSVEDQLAQMYAKFQQFEDTLGQEAATVRASASSLDSFEQRAQVCTDKSDVMQRSWRILGENLLDAPTELQTLVENSIEDSTELRRCQSAADNSIEAFTVPACEVSRLPISASLREGSNPRATLSRQGMDKDVCQHEMKEKYVDEHFSKASIESCPTLLQSSPATCNNHLKATSLDATAGR